MSSSEPSIFREQALKNYLQRRDQGILLRLISPPAFACLWILLIFVLVMGMLAWLVRVPMSVSGQGLITEPGQDAQQLTAVVFVPLNQRTRLHSGDPATLQLGSNGITLRGTVKQVESGAIGPDEARTRFHLQGPLTQVILTPSVAVMVQIEPTPTAHTYIGSYCVTSVQTGTQSVLSLVPGLNHILPS
ncbi:hypothetical protein KDH_06530 [Dictyobacter sp. S3.2.2.5]|uniref:Uncharacterized protein n=1 Tax=Dictyobacter halimunensis TaxID=3026934 RepID=A0ABQ6FI65_9CHLR|nr:hypothetical protein KDH_06530 [Dictyobacter sp. S3.2.2.5]